MVGEEGAGGVGGQVLRDFAGPAKSLDFVLSVMGELQEGFKHLHPSDLDGADKRIHSLSLIHI